MSDLRQKFDAAAAAITALTPEPQGSVSITATAPDELIAEMVAMGGRLSHQVVPEYGGGSRLITAVHLDIGAVTFSAQNGRPVLMESIIKEAI